MCFTYVLFIFQCFETIETAYHYVDTEELENPLIFIHSGIYHSEYLFIDTNVSMIGAGKFIMLQILIFIPPNPPHKQSLQDI